MYVNYFSLLGLIFLSIGVLLEMSLIPQMIKEVRRPRDNWTNARVYALGRPTVYVLTFLPFLILLASRILTPPASRLGAWVTVSVPFGLMCLAIFTYLSYTYKERS